MTVPTNPIADVLADGMILTIGSRTFRASSKTTFKQDVYVMSLLKKSGLTKMAAGFDPVKDDLDEVAQDIITEAFAAGQLFNLLGAVMEEVGVDWTKDGAEANAEFFANLSEPSDKSRLHGAIVGVLMGFFVSGALSGKASPKFSAEPRQSFDETALRDGVMQPSEAHLRVTSESGTGSSETSPGTTRDDSGPSSGGP